MFQLICCSKLFQCENSLMVVVMNGQSNIVGITFNGSSSLTGPVQANTNVFLEYHHCLRLLKILVKKLWQRVKQPTFIIYNISMFTV